MLALICAISFAMIMPFAVDGARNYVRGFTGN